MEINPGYLPLVAQYPEVRSLLHNSKVHIYIDDCRRWLLAHPDVKYDVMVANTSFHWRDHSSQVLSTEFLQIVKQHLLPGGLYYYNATESPDVFITGLHEYSYGLRVITFLMVSDSPIVLDKSRWFSVLNRYEIDGEKSSTPDKGALPTMHSDTGDSPRLRDDGSLVMTRPTGERAVLSDRPGRVDARN